MPSLVLLTETPDRHVVPLGRATLVVGSDNEAADLHLPSESVSRDHATVIYDQEEFILRDNGSTSGSYVNGEPVVSQRVLKHRDLIRFGEYLFLVDLHDEQSSLTQTSSINPSEDVTVSTGNSKSYQREIQITQGESIKKQTSELRRKQTSQNIRILLSEPIVMAKRPQIQQAKVPTATRGPRAVSTSRPLTLHKDTSTRNFWIQIVAIPIAALLSAYCTLLFLPVSARYALVTSRGFQTVPMNGLIRYQLLHERNKQQEIVTLRPGIAHGIKMTVTNDALVTGVMEMGMLTAVPVHLEMTIRQLNGEKTVLLEKVIEINPKTKNLDLFATVFPPGLYNFEIRWKRNLDVSPPTESPEAGVSPGAGVPSVRELPVTLLLTSHF